VAQSQRDASLPIFDSADARQVLTKRAHHADHAIVSRALRSHARVLVSRLRDVNACRTSCFDARHTENKAFSTRTEPERAERPRLAAHTGCRAPLHDPSFAQAMHARASGSSACLVNRPAQHARTEFVGAVTPEREEQDQ
jgi:hypothetical protein